jgi:hypothetical protein
MNTSYKGVALDLRSGDIVLYRNEWMWNHPITYLSVLVRLFTQCYYNHCASVVINWDKVTLNEALGKGVVARPAENHLVRSRSKIKIIRPKKIVEEQYCTKANSALGKPYDFQNLIFAHLLHRLVGVWLGKKGDQETTRMVCSEYCAWTHNLNNWWKLSARELEESPFFEVVYIEDEEGEKRFKNKQNS